MSISPIQHDLSIRAFAHYGPDFKGYLPVGNAPLPSLEEIQKLDTNSDQWISPKEQYPLSDEQRKTLRRFRNYVRNHIQATEPELAISLLPLLMGAGTGGFSISMVNSMINGTTPIEGILIGLSLFMGALSVGSFSLIPGLFKEYKEYQKTKDLFIRPTVVE